MRRDALLPFLPPAARRGLRHPRTIEPLARRRRRGRLERAQSPACRFFDARVFEPEDRRPDRTLLEGDDLGRLDWPPQGHRRSPAGLRRSQSPAARDARRRAPAQSRPALPQCALHHHAQRAVRRRLARRHEEVRRRAGARTHRTLSARMGELRADHDEPHLGSTEGAAGKIRPLFVARRLPHGRAHADVAEGGVDRLARRRTHLRIVWGHGASGFDDHSRHGMGETQGLCRSCRDRRGKGRRRRRPRTAAGRDWRNLSAQRRGPGHDLSLSRRGTETRHRRLGIARRCRPHRRRRLYLARRPPHRHDPARRRERVPGRSRGGADRPSRHRVMRCRGLAASRSRLLHPRGPAGARGRGRRCDRRRPA